MKRLHKHSLSSRCITSWNISADYSYTYHFHSPGLEPWLLGIVKGSIFVSRNVLDVGCGLGFWGYLIKAYVDSNSFIVGIDISQTKLKKLNSFQIYDALIRADCAYLPLRERGFNLVIAVDGFLCIGRVVKQVESVATNDGLIVLAMRVNKDQVMNLLSIGYRVLAYYLRGFCLVRVNDGKAILYRSFIGKILSPILSMAYKILKLRIVRYVIAVKMKR